MAVGLIGLASLVIWITVSRELSKPSKKQSKQKIITLMSAGSLSTLIITVSLFRDLPFFR
ncbi:MULTISPECIES: hypothetical protein [Virgibacillus]|uniref:hypothetical protein n=1 Tax=Virgibacillus TaxID=84406 RepID=UPI00030081DB|nr:MULTISPECIES: hypothetical protein [Virgibacillus]AIF42943.1 hypothetical protein X953_06900 [Virgibacillus sp. SK37]MYL56767.1 hypothetical protein [Virgibacillus halodenitrificans]